MKADTLRIDPEELARWKSDGDYDYQNDIPMAGKSWFDYLSEQIGNVLNKVFGVDYSDTSNIIEIVCIILFIALLLWILYKVNPHVFSKDSKKDTFSIEEDNIYGVDFDKLIEQARQQGNHREWMRMVYLRTLRKLSDAKLIDWQPSKTPTQYSYEYAKQPFRQMSQMFLLVRYANYPASADMAQQMEQLANELFTDKQTEER